MKLQDLIFAALDEVAQTLPTKPQVPRGQDLVLFGRDALLDSLALVSFIVILEEKLQDHTGRAITLVDDKAMSAKNSPFRSVSSLEEYIQNDLGVSV